MNTVKIPLPAEASKETAISLAIVSNTPESRATVLRWWEECTPQDIKSLYTFYHKEGEWETFKRDNPAQAESMAEAYSSKISAVKSEIEDSCVKDELVLVLHWSKPAATKQDLLDISCNKMCSLYASGKRVASAVLDSRTENCAQAIAQINIMFSETGKKQVVIPPQIHSIITRVGKKNKLRDEEILSVKEFYAANLKGKTVEGVRKLTPEFLKIVQKISTRVMNDHGLTYHKEAAEIARGQAEYVRGIKEESEGKKDGLAPVEKIIATLELMVDILDTQLTKNPKTAEDIERVKTATTNDTL